MKVVRYVTVSLHLIPGGNALLAPLRRHSGSRAREGEHCCPLPSRQRSSNGLDLGPDHGVLPIRASKRCADPGDASG